MHEANYLQSKSFIELYSCLCPVVSATNLDIVRKMKVDPRGESSFVLSSEMRITSCLPSDGGSGHLVDMSTWTAWVLESRIEMRDAVGNSSSRSQALLYTY